MCSNTLYHGVVLVFLDDVIIYTVDVTTYDIMMVRAYLYDSRTQQIIHSDRVFRCAHFIMYTQSICLAAVCVCVCMYCLYMFFYFWNIFPGIYNICERLTYLRIDFCDLPVPRRRIILYYYILYIGGTSQYIYCVIIR